ncbi:MAG: hypothetical protein KDG89_14570 [Geminicoccaceae bacterium]|nr:hypothetical protein [Geminicoccaceae bacterium]
MRRLIMLLALSPLLLASPGWAQDIQETASPEEAQAVRDEIAKIGCKAETIEKERDDLFEIDDAQCEIGQYDIKLNKDYKITSITMD